MEAMKITDQRGTPTRFDDLDLGDYFYEDDEKDPERLWIKVPAGKDDTGSPCNAVYTGSGLFHCFTAETRVQAVEIEILVLKNAENRGG
jgi:hypothetical protein